MVAEDANPLLSNQIADILTDSGHRRDISTAISPVELGEFLKRKGLIEDSEISKLSQTEEGVEFVLRRVEERGGEAFIDFLWCLEQSDSHLGHKYVVNVLKKTGYNLETLGEIIASTVLKQKWQKLKKMMRSLDVRNLFAQLLQKGLLTDKERDELMKPTYTRLKLFLKLERILAKKGPLACLYFTQALIDAKEENSLHQELLTCLFGSSGSNDSNLT